MRIAQKEIQRAVDVRASTERVWHELRGVAGVCLGVPVRLVLGLFQRYLLRSIRANAERSAT
jgi:hypothetical protein